MGNYEHKHKDNEINKKQKNRINYEEKVNTTTNRNDMKKVQVQQQKECQMKIMRKTNRQTKSTLLVKQNVVQVSK